MMKKAASRDLIETQSGYVGLVVTQSGYAEKGKPKS